MSMLFNMQEPKHILLGSNFNFSFRLQSSNQHKSIVPVTEVWLVSHREKLVSQDFQDLQDILAFQ